MGIPEDLVHQFRAIALDRLSRIETAWATVLDMLDEKAASVIHREIHTLKGESRMVGFTDVNMVCHKLEDLLEVARQRGYAVDDDFDLAVNMALRFMAMLVRKKVGAQLQGIDLPGFIKQIDAILHDVKPEPRHPRPSTGPMSAIRANALPAITVALRTRLSSIAVDMFIEYASSRGARRDRLRSSWHNVRDLIGIHRAMIGSGQLAKHKSAALQLARDLGKELDVTFEIDTAEVTAELLATIDTAVLHLLRNAIDHGIELPSERVAAGKSSAGKIRIKLGVIADKLVLEISDDGRGVQRDQVLAHAVDLGLVPPTSTDLDRWFDFICQPGFSTRSEASEVSGRGVGLDVVRAEVHDAGALLTATTEDGRGTTWTVTIPMPQLTISGWVLRAPAVPFPIVVDDTWTFVAEAPNAPVIDLAVRLGLAEDVGYGTPYFMTNGRDTIGIVSERPPFAAQARRLIASASIEIVTLDMVEGMAIHPERLTALNRGSGEPR